VFAVPEVCKALLRCKTPSERDDHLVVFINIVSTYNHLHSYSKSVQFRGKCTHILTSLSLPKKKNLVDRDVFRDAKRSYWLVQPGHVLIGRSALRVTLRTCDEPYEVQSAVI
jgi:hypothetical protein